MSARRRKQSEPDPGALASGVRLRIVRLTRNEALTNKELAERLDLDPSTAHYHIRKLVAAGFLVAQPTRKGNRGAKEIPYRSNGLPWIHGPQGERPLAQAVMDAYLAEVNELDIAEMTQIRFVLDMSPQRREEFTRRLDALLDEYDHDTPTHTTERTAIYFAVYPSK
jgi:DNA-binding transcriptional ArsR family regulator